MSQAVTFRSVEPVPATLLATLASFYRRWFASETIHNPRALHEIGLGHLVTD